ncbi:MAG: 3'(2'),5'-bisphosphate nucleotidase CysQ, partial [Cereibacter sp.]
MDFEKLTAIMRRLALEAGDRIMKVYTAASFEVKAKS